MDTAEERKGGEKLKNDRSGLKTKVHKCVHSSVGERPIYKRSSPLGHIPLTHSHKRTQNE